LGINNVLGLFAAQIRFVHRVLIQTSEHPFSKGSSLKRWQVVEFHELQIFRLKMLVNSCVGVVTTCPFNTFMECGGIPAVVLTSTLEPSEFIFGFTQMMRAHSFKWNCQNR
jgi:hypothetical protein